MRTLIARGCSSLLFAAASLLWWGVASAQSTATARSIDANRVAIVHSFDDRLTGVRAANRDVHLTAARDPQFPDEQVLMVEYPPPTGEPAARDVQCAAEHTDWTAGRAIAFHIKPEHPLRLSVSFVDRNRVVYTTWTDLRGGVWQFVRLPFDDMRPNPYFQPPDARTGTPIDVSDVKFIAFAPQDQNSGRLTVGQIVVSK